MTRADAFHVVAPSLPGFGFSDKPTAPGWGVQRIADAFSSLMARLGYDRYAAQGGDWGAMITSAIGWRDAEHLAGIHLNMPLVIPAVTDDITPQEQAALDAMTHYTTSEAGYSTQQSTRPQTLGYGLVDSPAGQAAWIVEKFYAWTDCDGHPENVLTRDELLDNVMLYWLPGTGASSGAHLLGELQGRRLHRDRGAGRVLHLPEGDLPHLAPLGRGPVQGPALLERTREGRPLRRLRAAGALRAGPAGVLREDALNPKDGTTGYRGARPSGWSGQRPVDHSGIVWVAGS